MVISYRSKLETASSGALEPIVGSDEVAARAIIAQLIADSVVAPLGESLILKYPNCPDCALPILGKKSPYCSHECRESAAFVRQTRASIETGQFQEPDRQVALGQKLWRLLGGGYPFRQTLVTEKQLAKIIERAGGKCSACDNPATTFDHLGSG